MNFRTKFYMCFAVTGILTGCIGCSSSSVSKHPKPPGYANIGQISDLSSRVNIDLKGVSQTGWIVACDGFSEIFVSRSNIDSFFKDDGSYKTQSEFCAQNASGSLIKKLR